MSNLIGTIQFNFSPDDWPKLTDTIYLDNTITGNTLVKHSLIPRTEEWLHLDIDDLKRMDERVSTIEIFKVGIIFYNVIEDHLHIIINLKPL